MWISKTGRRTRILINWKAVSQKMVDAFSLKFQRNNQKNASAMDSAKGKTGEKGCLFTVLWR